MSRTPELVVGDAVGDARRTAVVVVPEWLGLPTEPPERAWRIEARGGALLLMAPGGSVFLIEAPDAPRAEPASCVDEHVGLTPFGRRTTPAERAARALFDSLGAARRRRLALLLALLSEHRAADATPPGPLSALAAGTTSTRATDRAAPDAFLRFGATAADLADASGGGWEAILDPTARAHGDAAALARAIVANAALGRGAEAADAVVALCGRRPHLVDLCTDALLALHYPERASAMIAGLAAPAGGADHAWRARASAAMRVGDVALATLLSETHLGGRSIAGDERAAPPEPVADPDKPADRDAVTRTQSDIWSATPAEVCARLLALEDRFPGSELLHTYCGEIHLWTGDYGAAAVEFERALALYARSRWAHVGLACVHMLTGNFGDADRLLERVDRLVEPSPLATTHGITGELRRRQGEPRAAIEQLLVAVGAKPSRFAAWLNLALCYAEVGELDRASEALATFCSLAPALVWTATRGATATLERADIVTHADALFATMRGNRSSGYVTYFATDGVFCVAEPGLRAARHIASGLAADFRRDPGFILEDCRRWAPWSDGLASPRERLGTPPQQTNMAAPRPRLLEFSLSHFCEKARWALDHHRNQYDVVALAPGLHRLALRRVDAKASWVPVLVADGVTTQGSDAIIDWADARDPARSLTPSDPAAAAEARRLEQLFDDGFGRDLRAVLYAMLLEQPDVVIALWAAGQPWWVGTFYRLLWSQVSLGLRKLYRLRPERVAEARARFDATFDELDALVSDGRRYLVGDTLSRADLAAAALLSPLVVPAERPWQPNVPLTADVIAMQDAYRSRPGWAWVEGLYRGDRLVGG